VLYRIRLSTTIIAAVMAMVLLVMGAAMAVAQAQAMCGDEQTYGLMAAQRIPVGSVTISNDETNLYVTYRTLESWYLEEAHLHVLDYEPNQPLAHGSTPYKAEGIGHATTYTFTVPLGDLGFAATCGATELWLQANAKVSKDSGTRDAQTEAAYGGAITEPSGDDWHGNIGYKLACCVSVGGACQRAIAYGGDSEGEGDSWWSYYDAAGSAAQTIWAAPDIDLGSVTVQAGTIAVSLKTGWIPESIAEPVKIQGYQCDALPKSEPAAGQFTTYKGNSLEPTVDAYPCYVIHLDVKSCED